MYTLTVPALVRALTQLKHLLTRGEAHARAQGWDPAVLLGMRLAPDMLPLTRQVQIATDIAKNSVGRMTGFDAPKFDDTETTFEQLGERIDRTLAYIQSVPATAFEGAETRDITVPTRARGDLRFKGHEYLFGFILPNVHFHSTTAYGLMRHAGVPLGKADYLGPVGTGQG